MESELKPLVAAAAESPSEQNLVKLLDAWSRGWKHKGRVRAVGPGAYEKYCTLGLYGHGGIVGISRMSDDEAICKAVNVFLHDRFPGGSWTSIAILCNPKMGLHRDIRNMIGRPNHAITLGNFTGGRVWVEDGAGESPAQVMIKDKPQRLRGTWHDIHDSGLSFDARRFHQVEPHQGHMWALAAYTPQAFKHATNEQVRRLSSLSFPCPELSQE